MAYTTIGPASTIEGQVELSIWELRDKLNEAITRLNALSAVIGNTNPLYIVLAGEDGTAKYLFIEEDGTVKSHTAAPTQDSDGTVVGTQT